MSPLSQIQQIGEGRFKDLALCAKPNPAYHHQPLPIRCWETALTPQEDSLCFEVNNVLPRGHDEEGNAITTAFYRIGDDEKTVLEQLDLRTGNFFPMERGEINKYWRQLAADALAYAIEEKDLSPKQAGSVLRHVTAWLTSEDAKHLDTARLRSSIKNRWPVYADALLETETTTTREQTLARVEAITEECAHTLPQRLKADLEKFGRTKES
jgi:hypothetical protein